MLDITKKKSTNKFNIVGVINEIKSKEDTNKNGEAYVRCEIDVKVNQVIDGEKVISIFPVSLSANRYKKGTKDLNSNYDRIKEYANTLTSLGAENGKEASYVAIEAEIKENAFVSSTTGKLIDGWQLTTNFVNSPREREDKAEFLITGVVIKKIPEINKEGDETGRLIVKICVVGYGGMANVIDFIAEGSKADYISNNWEIGDTVKAFGRMIFSTTTEWVEEEVGFGDPIKTPKTKVKKELLITSGSPGCLSDNESYDSDDIKVILEKRKAYLESLESPSKAPEKKKDLGF